METRKLVIKDTITNIVIREWFFPLSIYDYVKKEYAQTLFNDFCAVNNLDKNKLFWEITK